MHKVTARIIQAVILSCLYLVTFCITAQAEPRQLKVDLGSGLTVPAGPESFRNDHNTGFHIFTGARYPLGSHTEIAGRIEYHLITIDFREHFNTNLDLGGGGIDMLLLGTDIKQYIRKTKTTFRPFVVVGGGWSRLSQSSITADLAFEQYAPLLMENQSRFYYNIGLGIDIKPASSLSLFIVIRYIEIQQDRDNIKLLPITLGIRL